MTRDLFTLTFLSGLFVVVSAGSAAPNGESIWRTQLSRQEIHPCLMFSPDAIPRIRERLKRKPYASWWASVRASENPRCQAFTWLMTGDEKAASAARRQLLQAYPSGYYCACGVATPLQVCAETYDLLYHYKGLSAMDHRIIRNKLAAACERMFLIALGTGPGQHPGNQRTRGVCALGTAALVLRGYGDSIHSPNEWLQQALDSIHQEANLTFWRDDGMFIEGPTYSSFTLAIMLPFARYYEQASGKWLFDEPRLHKALLYLVSITQPDGRCAAIGTTNAAKVIGSLRLCIGAGSTRMQRLCRWGLEEWSSLSGGSVRDIALFDDSVQAAVGDLSLVRFLPVTQEAHVRTAWSRHAMALWFKGKDPWLVRTNPVYSHGDVGSFVLHAYGELLAVDAGYDHWVSMNLYPPQLHNTLLVDGEGPVSKTPGNLENAFLGRFCQGGDIVSTYAGTKHRRTFIQIDGSYVVIADAIAAAKTHEYAWQIHTPVTRGEGSVAIQGNRASWTGFDPRSHVPGSVALEAVWAGPVKVETVTTSRWQPFSSDPASGSYDNWAVVARQSGAATRYLTLLYPHPSRLPAATIETPSTAGGRCIVLKQGSCTDTCLVLDPGVAEMTMGTMTTSARISILRERDGKPTFAYLAGPGTLTYRGQRLVVAKGASLTGTFSAAAAGGWRFSASPGVEELSTGSSPLNITALVVDGKILPVHERPDLGRLARSPETIELRFDVGSPDTRLFAADWRVTLDGVRLPPDLVDVSNGRVVARPGPAVGDGLHEIVVRLDDWRRQGKHGQCLLSFFTGPLLLNGGFEQGGERSRNWSLGTWSSNAKTRYEIRAVRDHPHSGKWCLMMKGIAVSLNMVASQRVDVKRGHGYVLRGVYRGDVAARASFCSQSGKNQYIFSPALGPSAKWIPFRWEFTVENPEETLLLGMRLGTVGTVYFDDLSLEEIVDTNN